MTLPYGFNTKTVWLTIIQHVKGENCLYIVRLSVQNKSRKARSADGGEKRWPVIDKNADRQRTRRFNRTLSRASQSQSHIDCRYRLCNRNFRLMDRTRPPDERLRTLSK